MKNFKKAIDWVVIVMNLFGCLYLPVEQLFIWLKTGKYESRDFFWVMGQQETLISSPYIHITDWIGANNILNYLFDIHLGVIAILLGYVWMQIRLKETD